MYWLKQLDCILILHNIYSDLPFSGIISITLLKEIRMRILTFIVAFTSLLMGFTENIQTFSADFEQHITDEHNKTLTYQGHVWSQKPDLALWRYESPVKKSVHIHGKSVVIIEPDLEQALMRSIEKDIDLLAILKSAKPLGNGQYEARFESQQFFITLDKGVIQQINYTDMFDNKVVLKFKEQLQNTPIDEDIFKAKIPVDYDIIR